MPPDTLKYTMRVFRHQRISTTLTLKGYRFVRGWLNIGNSQCWHVKRNCGGLCGAPMAEILIEAKAQFGAQVIAALPRDDRHPVTPESAATLAAASKSPSRKQSAITMDCFANFGNPAVLFRVSLTQDRLAPYRLRTFPSPNGTGHFS